jgi:integrase
MKGHVSLRGSVWYAVIDTRDPATGTRKTRWHSLPDCKGRREAQTACAALIAAKDGPQIDATKETVAAFFERWLPHIRTQVSLRSYERYAELARKNIIPLISGVKLARLQPAQISAAYVKALQSGRRDGRGGLSPRTVHHMHRVLKQALKQAVRWGAVAINPADAVDPPKVERKAMNTYDMAQTAALIDSLRETRMFIPVILGLLCGLRRGEIAALRWRSVNLETGSLAVVESAEQTEDGVRYKETKSGRSRNVKISTTVIEELRAWKARQAQEFLRLGARPDGDTFVVTKADGQPVQPRTLTHEWARLVAQIGLPRIRLHDTRHSHATHLLASNIHPKIASERLGHSKVGITLDLYSHVTPGIQDQAVIVVDDALRAAMNAEKGNR